MPQALVIGSLIQTWVRHIPCSVGIPFERGVKKLRVQVALTVSQRVAGSSPAGGAIISHENQRVSEPLGPLARSSLGDW